MAFIFVGYYAPDKVYAIQILFIGFSFNNLTLLTIIKQKPFYANCILQNINYMDRNNNSSAAVQQLSEKWKRDIVDNS